MGQRRLLRRELRASSGHHHRRPDLPQPAASSATELDVIRGHLERNEIELVWGEARFEDAEHAPHRRGRTTSSAQRRHIVIATGTRRPGPRSVPFDDERILYSDSSCTCRRLPKTMIVVGGGVIGTEYACMMATLGVRVTLTKRATGCSTSSTARSSRRSSTRCAGGDHAAAGRAGRGDPRGFRTASCRRRCRAASACTPRRCSTASAGRARRSAWGWRTSASSRTTASGSRSTRTTRPRCRTSTRSAT